MQQPLDSPFFDKLANRFVYLAHDDGFYCKLYCQNVLDFIDVLCYKMREALDLPLQSGRKVESDSVLWRLIERGLFLDLKEVQPLNDGIALPVYLVGRIDNIDTIYHSSDALKKEGRNRMNLRYANGTWYVDV